MKTKSLFLFGLVLTIIGTLALYVLELEFDATSLLIVKSVFYLSGLASLFFGWRLIEHKFPGRRDR